MILNDDQLLVAQIRLKQLTDSDGDVAQIQKLKLDIEQYSELVAHKFLPVVKTFDEIGALLSATRIWKDWSQQDLANKLELPLSQLQQYEAHYWLTAPYGLIDKVANLLEVKIWVMAAAVELEKEPSFVEAMNQLFGGRQNQ